MLAAVTAICGFALLRPAATRSTTEKKLQLPAKQPANDASGAAGWVWSDGTPGWEAGATVNGIEASGLQPVEIAAAQLSAARYGLDADEVHVVSSIRPGPQGVLAILAAPTLDQTPERTCLAALPQSDAPPSWSCAGDTRGPEDLSHARVLIAATALTAPARPDGATALYLAGVARGDVTRVVLEAPGFDPRTLYARGKTWGQFQTAVVVPPDAGRLMVYGHTGLVQTLTLNVAPGTQRVLR